VIKDRSTACTETGFYEPHALACESVADRVNCIILFREPGGLAAGLIAEGYGMKGFRIDTKSCNWGPMSGFVCADPRLTKDSIYVERNAKWTHEALSGHIVEKFFGKVEDASWVADVMPIVISKTRIEELERKSIIRYTRGGDGHYVGRSKTTKGEVELSWRLIPIGRSNVPWLAGAEPDHCVLCADKDFKQIYPEGLRAIEFGGYETILGLTNPGTKDRGFMACVTADYDLFAIWPALDGEGDLMDRQHFLSGVMSSAPGSGQSKSLPGGIARMVGVDTRLQEGGKREHHRFGDVSARTANVKVLLNTAIQCAGYPGGNAVHHNDEAGNFALAKGSLAECLPIIGFLPGVLPSKSKGRAAGEPAQTVLIKTLDHFKSLVLYARANSFREVAKPEWLMAAGVPAL
jgi:hypothetical protein